ncbi:MAG TPA: hypothetical protein VIK86_07925 [Candidatus Paceibacterota bacterium]
MKKSLTITTKQYNTVKAIANKNCLAVSQNIVSDLYNITKDQAFTVCQAVLNNYKYLTVKD